MAYDCLGMVVEKFLDMNAGLYWSIKQKSIDFLYGLQELWTTFEEYPQNIITLHETFNINATALLFDNYSSAKLKTFDFMTLLQFYEKSGMDKFELLRIKSILYYYLGGFVDAFNIFDDKLDTNDNSLSSRELFYYAKTAITINVETEIILKNCIKELKAKEKSAIDYYYLGQLYLSEGNRDEAKYCFKKFEDSVFSKVMLLFLGEKNEKNIAARDIINELKSLKIQYPLDYTKNDLSQFQTYFHICECQEALSKLGISVPFEPFIWKAFAFSKEDREAIIEKIRRIDAEKIKEKLQNEFIKCVEDEINNNIEKFSDDIRKKLREKNKIMTEELNYIDIAKRSNDDIENQLGLMIEDFKYNSPNFYLYLIQYYYLEGMINPTCNGKIDSEGIFTLYFYLIHTLRMKKMKSNEKIINDFLFDSAQIIVPYVGIKLLLTAVKTTYSIVANLSTEYLEFSADNGDKSNYQNFKDIFWRFIDNDRENLTEDEFTQKYITFEWFDTRKYEAK